jgi:hypothetical protein
MGIDWDIEAVNKDIAFYVRVIGCTRERAIELALEKYWSYFDKEKEIQEMKQELRKHYKIK